MTDEQPDGGSPRGGPSWMRNADRPASTAAPAAVEAEPSYGAELDDVPVPEAGGHAPPTGWSGTTSLPAVVHTGSIEDAHERVRPPSPDYSRHAVRPLPYAVASLISIGLLAAAMSWASRGGRRPGEGESLDTLNGVWYTLHNLLLPQARTYLPVGVTEATVVLVLSAATILTTALWIGRVGRNVAMGQASFGAGLALLAFPAWWTLPLTAGTFHEGGIPLRLDQVMRLAMASIVLVAQFLVFRWSFVNKVWRAGRIPGDLASLLLWIPELIPWGMYLGSSMVATMDSHGSADALWRPTTAMADWGYAVSAATTIAILALLVAVSIRQHIGISGDRRRDAEARDAARHRAVADPAPAEA